jgi:putative ABC transport system permease protein
MTVTERTYEIGVMRAVGSSKSQIFKIFLTEGFLIGAIGAVAGIFVGLGLARLFTNIFENSLGFPNLPQAELTPVIMLTGVAAGFAAVVAGSLYPSIYASRTDIMQAIRPSARNRRHIPSSALFTIGLVMFIFGIGESLELFPFHISYIEVVLVPLGLVIIGGIVFGQLGRALLAPVSIFSRTAGYVASRTGRRRLLRNTVSFGIIAVTLSFTVMIGGIQSGVQQALQAGVQEALGADIILVGNQSIPISFTNNLTRVSAVTYATPLSPASVPSKAFGPNGNTSSTIGVVGVDPTIFPKIISYTFVGSTSSSSAYSKLAADNESLLVPEGLATRLGVVSGDILNLLTYSSNTTIPFLVAGVFTGPVLQYINYYGEHYASDSIIVSLNSEAKYFAGDYKSPLFLVDLQNHDRDLAINTAHDIAISYPRYDFAENSLTLGQLLSLVNSTINRIFGLILLILYFALFIATLGISATMIMNVSERRREIGLLRSQGMSRLQITGLFLGEGILIGLFGFLLAVPAGLILLKGATNSTSLAGFWIPFTIPYGTILEALPLALIAVLAGSIYPAIRAARMEVTQALGQL